MEWDGKKGVHLGVPINGFVGRLEVIEGPTGGDSARGRRRRGSWRRA